MPVVNKPLMLGALVLVAASILLFVGLGRAPLQDYDESIFSEVSHEVLAEGHAVNLTEANAPYLQKPPLYFWLAAASSASFGESTFSLRFPSATLGLLLVLVVMLLAYELSEDSTAALLAGAILLAVAPFIETARQVRVDVPMAFFITLAAYGFVRGMRQPKYFVLFGAAVGLAIMTKSVVGVFALAAAPVFGVWMRRFDFLRSKYFWSGALLCVAIALPWHAYELWHYGDLFWREYIGFNVGLRFHQDLFNAPDITNINYIWYLANFAWPWTQLFVLGIPAVFIYWKKLSARTRASVGACATMMFLVIAVFFSAATKAPTYLMPLYPFAAVAIALVLVGFARSMPRRYARMLWGVALLCLALGLASTIYNGFHFNPYYAQTDELAREEQLVAAQVAANKQHVWYLYGGDRDVGAIEYDSRTIYPETLTGATVLASGDLVLMYDVQRANFSRAYPNVSTVALYSGAQIQLLQVVSEH